MYKLCDLLLVALMPYKQSRVTFVSRGLRLSEKAKGGFKLNIGSFLELNNDLLIF